MTAAFADLEATFRQAGPAAAIDRLIADLRERKEYGSLFYALLMKTRHALGVSPVPTGSNQDLPASVHEAFENGIRDAARTVGQLYLDDGNIPQAWGYFRMIGEPGPIATALEKAELRDDQDNDPLINIAFHQGVLPEKGFDWVLQRYGICSAITVMSSGELPLTPEQRAGCVRRLIRTLHAELVERLKAEIQRQQNFAPSATTIRDLIQGRDFLFADDLYHIDLSHLNAVVQMAGQLDPCPELALARDLCAYGKKLSPRFQYHTDPPFENGYSDYDQYLAILTGDDVEGGLAHFRKKADEADPENVGTYPAEVLVNLLLRLRRPAEALEVARKHLAHLGDQRLSCPNLVELCQQTGRYDVLAEVARDQGHAVNFVAGLIAKGDVTSAGGTSPR